MNANDELVEQKGFKVKMQLYIKKFGQKCQPRGGVCHCLASSVEGLINLSISSVLIVFTELGLTQMLCKFSSRKIYTLLKLLLLLKFIFIINLTK